VVEHGLLSHFGHVPECVRQGAGMERHEVLVAFSPSLGTTVPCFCADFFGVLAEERLGSLGRQVGVMNVERRCAERVHHLEDAHVHPGPATEVGVLWTR